MQWRGSGFFVLSWWYLVAGLAAAGVFVISFLDIRWGGRIVAAAFFIGAVIRLVARPSRKAGGLTVRSRSLDVLIMTALGIGVLIASATVNLDADPARTSISRTSR